MGIDQGATEAEFELPSDLSGLKGQRVELIKVDDRREPVAGIDPLDGIVMDIGVGKSLLLNNSDPNCKLHKSPDGIEYTGKTSRVVRFEALGRRMFVRTGSSLYEVRVVNSAVLLDNREAAPEKTKKPKGPSPEQIAEEQARALWRGITEEE